MKLKFTVISVVNDKGHQYVELDGVNGTTIYKFHPEFNPDCLTNPAVAKKFMASPNLDKRYTAEEVVITLKNRKHLPFDPNNKYDRDHFSS